MIQSSILRAVLAFGMLSLAAPASVFAQATVMTRPALATRAASFFSIAAVLLMS